MTCVLGTLLLFCCVTVFTRTPPFPLSPRRHLPPPPLSLAGQVSPTSLVATHSIALSLWAARWKPAAAVRPLSLSEEAPGLSMQHRPLPPPTRSRTLHPDLPPPVLALAWHEPHSAVPFEGGCVECPNGEGSAVKRDPSEVFLALPHHRPDPLLESRLVIPPLHLHDPKHITQRVRMECKSGATTRSLSHTRNHLDDHGPAYRCVYVGRRFVIRIRQHRNDRDDDAFHAEDWPPALIS